MFLKLARRPEALSAFLALEVLHSVPPLPRFATLWSLQKRCPALRRCGRSLATQLSNDRRERSHRAARQGDVANVQARAALEQVFNERRARAVHEEGRRHDGGRRRLEAPRDRGKEWLAGAGHPRGPP